jgi:nascent polypeptide-associated complex subunit alpha
MKRMGLKQEEVDALEVIIKCKDKDIIITEPSVIKVNMMGQENFQVSGKITERQSELFTEDDIQTIIDQTSCTKDQAKNALEQEKDLVKAILRIKSQ